MLRCGKEKISIGIIPENLLKAKINRENPYNRFFTDYPQEDSFQKEGGNSLSG